MSRAYPEHRFLSGHFAPVRTECDAPDLEIVGEVPAEIAGTYYRNGANPMYPPRDGYHQFSGDGMVHAFRIEDGCVAYRNRWMRTAKWELDREHREALWGAFGNPLVSDPRTAGTKMNVANTSVVWHGGRLLALDEGNAPFEFDPVTLDPIGPWNFDGALVGPMTAHPKIDPASGEMLFFGNGVEGMHLPSIAYHVADASGKLVRTDRFDAPHASMVHDFIVTENYVVFPIYPATIDATRIGRGGPLIAWDDSLRTEFGVLRRDAPIDSIRWLQTDPVFAYHPFNAYEEEGGLVVDLFVYGAAPGFPGADGSRPDPRKASARLERWRVDPAGGIEGPGLEILDPAACEYGRIDERFAGRRNRHGWYVFTEGDQGRHGLFDSVAHFDFETGKKTSHSFGAGHWFAEPMFVPRSAAAREGDGFMLSVVYDPDTHRSDFVVYEAQDVGSGPIAMAKLETRVPAGFHAAWKPL